MSQCSVFMSTCVGLNFFKLPKKNLYQPTLFRVLGECIYFVYCISVMLFVNCLTDAFFSGPQLESLCSDIFRRNRRVCFKKNPF